MLVLATGVAAAVFVAGGGSGTPAGLKRVSDPTILVRERPYSVRIPRGWVPHKRKVTNAVARIPWESSARYPATSRSAHRDESDGSSAVNTETAKIAWGSWKKMNAEL